MERKDKIVGLSGKFYVCVTFIPVVIQPHTLTYFEYNQLCWPCNHLKGRKLVSADQFTEPGLLQSFAEVFHLCPLITQSLTLHSKKHLHISIIYQPLFHSSTNQGLLGLLTRKIDDGANDLLRKSVMRNVPGKVHEVENTTIINKGQIFFRT